jgi:ribosomal protein S19
MSFLPRALLKQLKHREIMLLIIPKTQRERFLKSTKSYYSASSKKIILSQNQIKLLSIKAWNLKTIIRKDIVYLPISIYCGKTWKTFLVLPSIIGHCVGSFVFIKIKNNKI